MQETRNAPSLFTVKAFVKRHATWATDGSIRALIFHADTNGFDR